MAALHTVLNIPFIIHSCVIPITKFCRLLLINYYSYNLV